MRFHAPYKMKIVYLVAGPGGMYCGSCLQGNTLVARLRAVGQDCLLAPTYTPIRTDEENVSIDRVAFGGINVYLQQHSAVFRHTPWFFDRLFDQPGLLRSATGRSRVSGRSTRRHDRLDAGRREGPAAEGGRETSAMAGQATFRPDVVHLNNIHARSESPAKIKRKRLGATVVRNKRRRHFSGKADRAAPRQGYISILRERAAELDASGGDESLLCRFHGRVSPTCRATEYA